MTNQLPPEKAFTPTWPAPDERLLRPKLPPAPVLNLNEILKPELACWIEDAAQSKGAPTDYVFAAILTAVGATIGNARWVEVWDGWVEPPVIWAMCIGLPSAGKSPAIDAAINPLRHLEQDLRKKAKADRAEWEERAKIAKLAEQSWQDNVKTALKGGETPPERPRNYDAGQPPHIPRLVVNDGTIERLGAMLDRQPRGTLQMRDELAGWLEGMQRYSGGGNDRPFWLEAYGGRAYTVERMGRDPVSIDHLSISVLGGIQPDRLNSLFMKADDDGLLSRFLPIFPERAPLCRPRRHANEAILETALSKLHELVLVEDENGALRPRLVPFSEDACKLMDDFRQSVRDWEDEESGLMLSFIGKLSGLAARLALVLAFLDWATEGGEPPQELNVDHFGRAAHLIEAYLLPMARRSYASASTPKPERAARQLVEIIRKQGWSHFTSRDVLRLERSGLSKVAELDPALAALEEGDCIRAIDHPSSPQGGRPRRKYLVNPALHGGRQ